MITREKLISDIELRLTKGKPSDDLELERSQIGHWVDAVRDELVTAQLNKSLRDGKSVNPIYVEKIPCLEIQVDDDTCTTDCYDIGYIELPNNPLGLYRDMGILKVATNENLTVHKTSVTGIELLKDLPFSKATKENLLYYRVGKKIYIEGISKKITNLEEFHVWYVPSYKDSNITDLEEYKIDDEVLPVLLDAVEEIGRRQLGGQEDLENDGNQ
jgi:hypothetical protein